MARQVLNVTISEEGRDKGKIFVITEMSAAKAEAWAMRALLALIKGGVDLPEGSEHLGMAGIAEAGLKALGALNWEIVEPLMAEMFECVQVMPDPKTPQVVRGIFEGDIEEITTRVKLRAEIWKLHTGFLKAATA